MMAADLVWLDALVTNPDRTVANPNLLVWHGRIWCIDHGAALYIHHTWREADAHARRPFERIADHVLLPYAASVIEADSDRCGWNVSTAHWMILLAGAFSNSALISASSSSVNRGMSRGRSDTDCSASVTSRTPNLQPRQRTRRSRG